ncbi:class I SAM-dependent methyltransferase [Candidatus Woesebacteria bacterium]|nr:class I SAM-dependent methyltransferase [Candidatus Woesebacteria bacterium]
MSSDKDVIKSVQDFYNQAGVHFSRTRQKKYGSGSSNWVVTDEYLARLKPGQSVLDLGCGNGKLVTALPTGVNYLGTDFSETLLNEARQLHPEHKFIYGDVLSKEDWAGLGTYDAIFCVAVLHHIPSRNNQVYVLKEIRKHLNPGGFMFLTVWNLWQEKFLQYHLGTHVEVPYNKTWKRYCVAYELPEMMELCADAGLTVEEIFYADRAGKRADIQSGENLVVIAN